MVGLSFQHLSTQEVIAVVRPKHPQLEAGFSPEVLQDYPLILPPKGALISPAVMSYLQLNGQQNIQPMFESVSLSFGRKVVMLSDAIWFISRSVVEDDLEAGSLSELPLQNPMMAGAIGICLREGAMYSDEIRRLIDILMEMASAGAPSSAS